MKPDNGKNVYVGMGSKTAVKVGDTFAKAGMTFEGEVDENNYNKFVSGKVYFEEDNTQKGNKGKSSFDTVGQAVGGASARAMELLANKIIKPKGAGVTILAQHYLTEMVIKAVKQKKATELAELLKDVDVTSFEEVVTAYKAFTKGAKEEVKPEPTPEPKPEPKVEEPTLPEGFGVEQEDDEPF